MTFVAFYIVVSGLVALGVMGPILFNYLVDVAEDPNKENVK